MLFRRRKSLASASDDGTLYVEDGQDYDRNLYETDSDYSDSEEEGSEEEEGEEEGEEEEENNEDEKNNEIYSDSGRGGDGGEMERKAEELTESYDTAIKNVATEDMNGITRSHDSAELTAVDDKKTVFGSNFSTETKPAPSTMTADTVKNVKSKIDGDGLVRALASESETKQTVSDDLLSSSQQQATMMGEVNFAALSEKRSLLALAAERDRVDIIKTVLQSSNDDISITDNFPMIQLLLNNRLISTCKRSGENSMQFQFSEGDLEQVFLPPLHLAIASSSINATSCLLRMGADPSIRPSIPKDWIGPSWTNVDEGVERMKPGQEINKFTILNGFSAWELAFGLKNAYKSKEEGRQTGKKDGWFHWSASNTSENGNHTEKALMSLPVKISPSKLEGIRHSFMAEVLRAIGSDEVQRLNDFLKSGLDGGHGDIMKDQVENRMDIGGKDLSEWCDEMGAVKCGERLKSISSCITEDLVKEERKVVEVQTTVSETHKNEHGEGTNLPLQEETRPCDLQTQIEENESLCIALSNILDNLSEEVSIIQGLLFQSNQSSNSTLLSQVRALKEARVQKEDELSTWESKLADRVAELEMVLMWSKNRFGIKDEPIIEETVKLALSSKDNRKKCKTPEMIAQVSLSENKVKRLQKLIADLAEEKSNGMSQIEKMGLGGAIKLATKLTEEVRETEFAIENAKSLETDYCARIAIVRDRLEDKVNVIIPEKQTIERNYTEASSNQPTCERRGVREVMEDKKLEHVNDSTVISDENNNLLEIMENTTPSEEHTPTSEVIAKGKSTAITARGEGAFKSYLPVNIWNLILRIALLGKQSLQKAVRIPTRESQPRVMIV